MKSIRLISCALLLLLSSCVTTNFDSISDIDKLIERNKQKITISSGLTGTLLKKEGNCMPTISTCKEYPVSRTILIYEYATIKEVVGYGPLYDKINSTLIGQCVADQDGFFQIKLTSGKYSVFIKEGDKFYANGLDGQGGINPFTIKTDSVSIIKLTLDFAYY